MGSLEGSTVGWDAARGAVGRILRSNTRRVFSSGHCVEISVCTCVCMCVSNSDHLHNTSHGTTLQWNVAQTVISTPENTNPDNPIHNPAPLVTLHSSQLQMDK